MSSDFEVIFSGKKHFGDQQGNFNGIEPVVDFEGPDRDYPFSCPNVDPSKPAILMFESLGVTTAQSDVIKVNGVDVRGVNTDILNGEKAGIPASPNDEVGWSGNVLILEGRRHQLKATGNQLTVVSRTRAGTLNGNRDDFLLDNMVIMYKTRPRTISPGTNSKG
jgi:hypothetical protein